MKKISLSILCTLIALFTHAQDSKYASKLSQEVIEKMIEAHGGMEKWKKAKSFSFDNIMFRINDSFTNIDGLIYPNMMHTGNLDQTRTYGNHIILNYDLTKKFDENKTKMPKNAVIDTSNHLGK